MPAAAGQGIQVLHELVAEPGAVDGDHEVPPERRRQRRDRRVGDRDVISSGIAARRALAQHPRQRLPAGVIAERQQRMQTFSELEICPFNASCAAFRRMRGSQGGWKRGVMALPARR